MFKFNPHHNALNTMTNRLAELQMGRLLDIHSALRTLVATLPEGHDKKLASEALADLEAYCQALERQNKS